MSFLTELKRRNVFRVGIAYAVGAWLLLQLTEVLSELLNLPEQVGPIVVAVVAIGFPIVLFVAWAFELTPQGLMRESEVDRSRSIVGQTGRKLDRFIIVMLVFALGYFVWESRFAERGSTTTGPAATSEDASGATMGTAAEAEPEIDPHSIAVLPFDNRSDQTSDTYFVEGIHDDLLTNLARISALKVISRTSVGRFKDTELPIPQIAKELGVATVMEGAVQRAGDTVRINVQLIDAATDKHLWAEIFDRELTTDNLFAIQSEIAEAIAAALETTLTPEEQQRISERPTHDLAAYNAYLRGGQLVRARTSESVEQARREFRRALEADPGFAQAWVGLAEATLYAGGYSSLPWTEAMASFREDIDKALGLNPELGEAWAYKGVALQLFASSSEAEHAYRQAVRFSPNNANVHKLYAEFLRADPDRLPEAAEEIDTAIELDPFWSVLRLVKAQIHDHQLHYELAHENFRLAVALEPESALANINYALFLSGRLQDLDRALELARTAIDLDPGNPMTHLSLSSIQLELGNPDAATAIQERLREMAPDSWALANVAIYIQMYQSNYKAALETTLWVEQMNNAFPGDYIRALLLAFDGQVRRSGELLAEAFPQLLERDRWAEWRPPSHAATCDVGWILQRSGHEQLGKDLVRKGLADLEETLAQPLVEPHQPALSICLAAAGRSNEALSALEQRLDHGHIEQWWWEKHHPAYNDIRNSERFHAAWDRLESEIAVVRNRLAPGGRL